MEGPVGDHAADGVAENAVKDNKRHFRVLKSSWEEKPEQHVLADHPVRGDIVPENTVRRQSREGPGSDG